MPVTAVATRAAGYVVRNRRAITRAARAGVAAYRTYRNYTRTRDKAESDKKGQTTTSTDTSVLQYKKRRMSRKKQRGKKKAYKRFVKQALKLVGTNVAVINESQSITPAVGQGQVFNVITLGGKSWQTATGFQTGADDMRKVMGSDDRLSKVVNNTKCLIQSTRSDVTYRNAGTAAAEVDMYLIKHYGDKHIGSYAAEVELAQNRTPLPAGATGSDPTMSTRGMTLFDFPLLSKMGNQILKKTKFIVPANGVITHSFGTKKNVWFDAQEITGSSPTDADHYVKHGYTTSLVFVTKAVIGNAITTVIPTIGSTNVYKYKIFQDNRDFNVYNPT